MEIIKKISNLPNQKMLIIAITLLIINILLILIISSKFGVKNLDGTYAAPNSSAIMFSAGFGIISSLTLLSFFLSFITARFIDKKLTFKKRYVRGYLFTLIILSLITGIRFLYLVVF